MKMQKISDNLIFCARNAIKQYHGSNDQVRALWKPENIATSLRTMRRNICTHPNLTRADLFLIDFISFRNPERLRVINWPGQNADPAKIAAVRREILEAHYLLQGIGMEEVLSRALTSRDMGDFPAMIACPEKGPLGFKRHAGISFYNPNANFTSVWFASPDYRGATDIVHEWTHQLFELTKEPPAMLNNTRFGIMMSAAVNEAYAHTLEYISSYIAHKRGNSVYWNILHKIDGSQRDVHNYSTRVERIAATVTTLQELLRRTFRSFALTPRNFHLDHYSRADDFAALPLGELNGISGAVEKLLPFGPDAELMAQMQDIYWVQALPHHNGQQRFSQMLITDKKLWEAAELLEAEYHAAQREICSTASTDKMAEIAFDIYMDQNINNPSSGTIPASLLQLAGAPQGAQYQDFVTALRNKVKRDTIRQTSALTPAALSEMTAGQRSRIFRKFSILTEDDIAQHRLESFAHYIGAWRSFDTFVNTRSSFWAEKTIIDLHRSELQFSMFQRADDRRTATEFAQDIGFYQALSTAHTLTMETEYSLNPSGVFRKVGLAPLLPLPPRETALALHHKEFTT